jgi:hypothetical protein
MESNRLRRNNTDVGKLGQSGPKTNIRFKTTMHGTVVLQVMLWKGWTETDEEYDWDVFWYAAQGLACGIAKLSKDALL